MEILLDAMRMPTIKKTIGHLKIEGESFGKRKGSIGKGKGDEASHGMCEHDQSTFYMHVGKVNVTIYN